MSAENSAADALVALPRGRAGELLRWYVGIKDRVYKGQALALYHSDGLRKELKSPASGVVTKLLVQEEQACESKYVGPDNTFPFLASAFYYSRPSYAQS